MEIRPSRLADLDRFREFWNAAIAYQRQFNYPLWSEYPESTLRDEIGKGLHYSAYTPDDVLAGYFSVSLSDYPVWEADEKGDAIYVHRMCVNPARRGHRLAEHVLAWALGHAAVMNRKYVRMDTWGADQRLVDHYISCGFKYVRSRQLGIVPGLPPHYDNIKLAMFENEI